MYWLYYTWNRQEKARPEWKKVWDLSNELWGKIMKIFCKRGICNILRLSHIQTKWNQLSPDVRRSPDRRLEKWQQLVISAFKSLIFYKWKAGLLFIENSCEFPMSGNCGQWREYFLFIPERSCVLQAFLLPAFALFWPKSRNSFYKNAIRRIPLQIGFANLPLQPLVSNLLPFFYARSRESVQDSCCPGSRRNLPTQ